MHQTAKIISKASLLILFMFIFIGGCDVDFGTGSDDDNDNGETGVEIGERVEGTIVDTIPSRSAGVDNIDVTITDEETNDQTTGTTGVSGFFSLSGNFSGSPDIEFFDNEDGGNSLGIVILNVFPGAEVELGDISLENGVVNFLDDTEVSFEADLIENNCNVNTGTLVVEIDLPDTDNELEILIQISTSTDIEVDGLDSDCNDFLIGQELEINGRLLIGNSVDATDIEVD